MSWKEILGKYGFSSLLKDIWYRLDWRKPNPNSVKEFLISNVQQAKELQSQGKLPKFQGTQDQNMIKILQWVNKNIKYEVDSKRFKVAEKWQTVEETITFKRGDCEDGAILIFALARIHKISSYSVRVVAGNVLLNGKQVGHCWVEYYPDEYSAQQAFTIDWCYWMNDSEFSKRDTYNDKRYLTQWFNITDMKVK